jgi:tetratricopeptide (TPR) repeat protein
VRTHGHAASLTGKVDEGKREIEQGLGLAGLSPETAASCHIRRAYVAQNAGDGATAERHARLALASLGASGRRHPRTEALVVGDLGYAQQLQGRIGDADKSFAASIEQLTGLGLEWTPVAGTILNNWGIAVLYAGDVRRALDLWERARAVVTARDPAASPPGYLLSDLARANEQVGHFAEALALYEQTTSVGRATGGKPIIAVGLNGQSTVHMLRGDLDRAEALLAETRAVTDTLPKGSPATLNADVLGGRLALARGRLQEAWDTFTRLQAVYDAQPPNPGAAGIRVYLSEVALKMGRADAAATLADEGVQRSRALQGGMPYSRAVVLGLFALARARYAQGRLDEEADQRVGTGAPAERDWHPAPGDRRDPAVSGRPGDRSLVRASCIAHAGRPFVTADDSAVK